MKIIVDCPQQHKGKNIGWRNYSCINAKTGRKLKYNLGHYIDNLGENYKKGHDTNHNAKS